MRSVRSFARCSSSGNCLNAGTAMTRLLSPARRPACWFQGIGTWEGSAARGGGDAAILIAAIGWVRTVIVDVAHEWLAGAGLRVAELGARAVVVDRADEVLSAAENGGGGRSENETSEPGAHGPTITDAREKRTESLLIGAKSAPSRR